MEFARFGSRGAHKDFNSRQRLLLIKPGDRTNVEVCILGALKHLYIRITLPKKVRPEEFLWFAQTKRFPFTGLFGPGKQDCCRSSIALSRISFCKIGGRMKWADDVTRSKPAVILLPARSQ